MYRLNSEIPQSSCKRCGAPLDASKLHCDSCNTDYVLDWGKVVIEAVPQSTRFRDRVVDAVLIAALQREAIAQDVEIALILKKSTNESHLWLP